MNKTCNYKCHTLVKYKFPADFPFPALMGEQWDNYFKIHAILHSLGQWIPCEIPTTVKPVLSDHGRCTKNAKFGQF